MAAIRPANNAGSSLASKSEPPLLLMGMATCHSLTIIDGVLSGDPLDLNVSHPRDVRDTILILFLNVCVNR